MKYFLTLTLAVSSFLFASSQDITGTWAGYFKLNKRYAHDARSNYYSFDKDSMYLHVELSQNDRKLTSLFYYGNSFYKESPIVVYKAFGFSDKKKPLDFFKILADGVIEDNIKRQVGASFIRMF
ncbi:MAG: hypothetical protein JST87_11100 [Bacteroidetes bacterium]|nr:hypothetical protein [Bacteroidota bacterium]